MQLGLFTMPLHPPGADFTQTLKADLDQIVKLDELGYSEVWIGEHFTCEWENIPAPDLLIAQALPLTKQIRLGTGVSCIPNHDPFVLAHRIAQLDHMAEGRFNWGVGIGSFPGDMMVFGYWGEDATINNASYTRAALDTIEAHGSLAAFFWSFEPGPEDRPAVVDYESLISMPLTPHSTALSKALRKLGWRFVGPTTCYALMQASGIVNDHLEGCHRRPVIEAARMAQQRPT